MRKTIKVLLAVDGSDYSLAAVEEAASMPWPADAVVKIVCVAETPMLATGWIVPMAAGTAVETDRFFEDRAIANVTQAMSRFGEIAGAQTEVSSRMLNGNPKGAILDEAERWGADLIILGTHGYNAFERFWLGSVSFTVMMNAKCSVHLARTRGHERSMSGKLRILLAVDGSDSASAAVEEVATRPFPPGSEVRIVSAVDSAFAVSTELWAVPDGYYPRLVTVAREQSESAVATALNRLRQSNHDRDAPLTVSGEVIAGKPREIILETAKDWAADIIFVGSHGHGSLASFLLGSVSHAVASHAPCSVEIVRAKKEVDQKVP